MEAAYVSMWEKNPITAKAQKMGKIQAALGF